MKKGKQNFKILTKAEASEVKGGSWFSSLFSSIGNTLSQIGAGNGGGGCPPPEPD